MKKAYAKLIILTMEYSKEIHFHLCFCFFFSISLIPLSIELKNTDCGYKTITNKKNLFYIDHLKLYAKNDDEFGLVLT